MRPADADPRLTFAPPVCQTPARQNVEPSTLPLCHCLPKRAHRLQEFGGDRSHSNSCTTDQVEMPAAVKWPVGIDVPPPGQRATCAYAWPVSFPISDS